MNSGFGCSFVPSVLFWDSSTGLQITFTAIIGFIVGYFLSLVMSDDSNSGPGKGGKGGKIYPKYHNKTYSSTSNFSGGGGSFGGGGSSGSF